MGKSAHASLQHRWSRQLIIDPERTFYASNGNIHGPGEIGIYRCGSAERFTYHYYPATGGSVIGENTLSWGSDGWPSAGSPVTTGLKLPCTATTALALDVSGKLDHSADANSTDAADTGIGAGGDATAASPPDIASAGDSATGTPEGGISCSVRAGRGGKGGIALFFLAVASAFTARRRRVARSLARTPRRDQ